MLMSLHASRLVGLQADCSSPMKVQSIVIVPPNGSALMRTTSISTVLPWNMGRDLSGMYWKFRVWRFSPSITDTIGAIMRKPHEANIHERTRLQWCRLDVDVVDFMSNKSGGEMLSATVICDASGISNPCGGVIKGKGNRCLQLTVFLIPPLYTPGHLRTISVMPTRLGCVLARQVVSIEAIFKWSIH